MIISIINHTNGKLRDEDVQQAIRAINRQIGEDFAPYWGMDATLRLEGRSTIRPDPQGPADMRGDAVIYLWDQVDVEDAVGYHDATNRGIAYGFVFLEVAKDLGEPWTVTLSHEALELIGDPEVNLLVKGPHPTARRDVFHWYEMCDAVQDERYQIDGVWISNFVLPLYFTSSEETGGRNDFLGRVHDGRTLRSFGVNPGGYIGFYDPDTGRHHTSDADTRAQQRREIKYRAASARRAIRYQQVATRPAAARAGAEPLAPVAAAGPVFEAFAIEVERPGQGSPADVVRAIVAQVLGPKWRIRPTGSGAPDFLVTRRDATVLSVREAWEQAYRLRATAGVVRAEPLFAAALGEWDTRRAARAAARASGLGAEPLQAALDDPEWSLKQVRAHEAWALAPPRPAGRVRGEGIVIGHPDTGYTEHPEIWPQEPAARPLIPERGFDFVDEDADAHDPVGDAGLLEQPGHGTGTASVIVSGEGSAGAGPGWVTGVAPRARLIPFRTSRSVILWSMSNLAQAIYRAVENGAHVISISMGGLWSGTLHAAVSYAVGRDVIVLAAAGNIVPFVVWPAAYEEVLAVAATNVLRKPWVGSSHGPAVDFSAPGESVWRATPELVEGTVVYRVGPGDGTSYAVATAAGTAALWLAFHGRQYLIEEVYGPGNLAEGFKRIVLEHGCDTDPDWDPDYGAGIVNAERVLHAPLPAGLSAPGMKARRRRGGRVPRRPADLLEHLLPEVPAAGRRAALGALLAVTEREWAARLDEVGEEIAFHLATHEDVRRHFIAQARAGLARRARARGRAAVAPDGGDAVEGLRAALRTAGASRRLLGTARR